MKTWWKELDEQNKFGIKMLIGCWFFLGLMIGVANSAAERSNGRSGCVYRSVSSFVNVGYIAGCELFRKRFEVGK